MYAITGITGQVGGAVAANLRQQGHQVRAVLRDAGKGRAWSDRGCEVALATMDNTAALASAFRGMEGVFVLMPPNFDPQPGFPEARGLGQTVRTALAQANPGRVVYLSTVGAQATEPNLLSQHGLIEKLLGDLPIPITFLRPAWFMENCSWDVAPAKERGVIPSFLQPLDKAVPMVATADIGKVAAELLQEPWTGHRVVELEGPKRVAPNDIAAVFARLLGRSVRTEAVPRESWEALFKSQGMTNPLPRIRMLDGFNEGWIDFEGGQTATRKGSVPLETVLKDLIGRSH